jgi:hypothetical protein
LLDRGHHERLKPLFDALAVVPPRTTLVRATVCQHIRIEPVLPWLKALCITDLFWSHARVNELELDGIRLHPFPLYAVRVLDRPESSAGDCRRPPQRRYLYSFIGAYSPDGYLSPARQWIYELPPSDDAFVMMRNAWHYESAVYGEQIAQQATPLPVQALLERNGDEYDAALSDSIFSLCPSGSGPNSIRLWESLGFGCIPVLLSDSLRLPGATEEWEEAIVRVPETYDGVMGLPARLREIARDPNRLERMQKAGRGLWVRYGVQGPAELLGKLADPAWVRAQIASTGAALPGRESSDRCLDEWPECRSR